MTRTILTMILMLLTTASFAATQTLVAKGATWKFVDDGVDQGTAWRGTSFNDTSWGSGPGILGYGAIGASALGTDTGGTAANITAYFRHEFNVTDPNAWVTVDLNVLHDDGVVIYLNGSEVGRAAMPTGTIDHNTLANVTAGGTDEDDYATVISFDASLLVAGTNLLSAEVHQTNNTSSDLGFDLEAIATDVVIPPGLARGPYLHVGTPTSIVVRWRTDTDESSEVRYGTDSANLNQIVNSTAAVTEHELQLSGLTPDTTYYYSIGPIGNSHRTPADGLSFKTSPVTGSTDPVRIWTIGDAGTANSDQQAVYNAYQTYAGSDYTNVFMMLGDNAYNTGTDAEYQAAVFDMYPEMLAASSLWSCRGNHEGIHAGFDYYDIFTFPTAGEAGGLASGSEAYYSFNVANIHFICLDSHGTDRSTTGAMYTWCESDLQQNTLPWVICFFHHPPYTKGSHNSDDVVDSGGRMQDMRQNFLPLLESHGVDLVMSGHSHCYERSFLIDGHYGDSDSFSGPTHGVDLGDGNPAGTGSYEKVSYAQAANEGTVYIVAGSSGKLSGTEPSTGIGGGWPHEAMQYYDVNLGSMVIDVTDNVMDVRFLRETGAIDDYFQIIKGTVETNPPSTPGGLAASNVSWDSFDLSWNASTDDSGIGSYGVFLDGVLATTVASTSASLTGLSPITSYSVTVVAYDLYGNASSASSPLPVNTTAAPPTTVYEAEDAALADGVIATNNQAGASNGYFADYPALGSGGSVTWTITVTRAGDHDLSFGYACSGSARPLSLLIDDVEVNPSLDFPGTGGWSTWSETAVTTVNWDLGDHTVQLLADVDQIGANVDYLKVVQPSGPVRSLLIGSGAGGPAWQIVDPVSAPSGTAEGDDTRFNDLDATVDHTLAPIGAGG